MIRIDHISFEFATADERFVRNLYADWDDFCRDCFEKVVDECLSSLDRDKVLHEIELLDLDLGSIPEEDFYREFPRQLRAELLKVLPSWGVQTENERKKTDVSRLKNLLFYLERGYLKVEWGDSGFNLAEELDWVVSQQALHVEEIVSLCMRKNYALRRLLWQTSDDKALIRFYTVLLSMPSSGLNEKSRFLAILLEMKPGILVRFIHEDTDDNRLHDMAELLDTLSVRRIMETETEEHAEVDLPPYWHYLYEWLINYYPFNGIAIFGGKGDFIRHLHHRLLTFIRKRNYSFYLSKMELTLSFLLEVFGPDYCKDVLNVIYDLQPHYTDGSPMHDGYLNRELYRIFLQLSLLHMPMAGESPKENPDSGRKQTNILPMLLEGSWNTRNGFADWLEDATISMDSKRELLQKMVVEKTHEWIGLLRRQPEESKAVILTTTYLSVPLLLQSVAQVDLRQAAILSETIEWLQRKAGELPFLTGNDRLLSTALSEALLLFMQDRDTLGGRALTEKEVVNKFLAHLHFVYTGKTDFQSDAEWTDLPVNLAVDLEMEIKRVADNTLPESVRKRILYNHILFRPKELLDYICQSVVRNTLPASKWLEWMNTGGWLRLVASRSLSQAELLRQVMDYISINYPVQKEYLETALATYIIENPSEEWAYNSKEETIRSFVKTLPMLQGKTESELKNIVNMINETLMPEEENNWLTGELTAEPEIFFINNAGLSLLSAWFLRLMNILDYLNEERKDIKDTKSRIRAIFLLQYLTCQEEKEYRETELVFNRLLVGLPMHIPLPKRLELTAEEKQTADSMLSGVKSNWQKMSGTSMKGFLQSFVARTGRLEEQAEKWVLTVDDKTHDILLDSVPWGFRQIRLPWLKKYIQVKWHEKQEF